MNRSTIRRATTLAASWLIGCGGPTDEFAEPLGGQVWGGGEVTVTFTTTEGVGLSGAFTVEGSQPEDIEEDGLVRSTALWSYVWEVEGEPPMDRYKLNIRATPEVDFSELVSTFSCEIDPAILHLQLEDIDFSSDLDSRNQIHASAEQGYRAYADPDWRSPKRRMEDEGTLTMDIEWWDLDEACPAEIDETIIGKGVVTVDWRFDPDTGYTPDGRP